MRLLLPLAQASLLLAASLTLYLPAVPNPFALPPTTHATLSTLSKEHSAPISSLNTFVFHNVTPGSYLADIHCKTDGFRPVRIDVSLTDDGTELVQAWDTFRGNEWANKGEALLLKGGSAGQGIEVKSIGKKIYFVERPQFSVLSILKNPMILMGLVSMVIFFGMPKLVDNMDPEMKAEFEASQRASPLNAVMGGGGGQQQNPLGDFDMAAFLAGSNKKESAAGPGNANDGRNEPVRR
ncbi:hypothetical protein QQS21_007429 [Conoideocrella luteorostrata]|uniref:ER membrane protein complex subunit 7 beta-sandwich domain-containing protein n=1 Tax=Conoideocrella luteorostrata TaxID=1105319 RepID=A0AAJ0CNL8_9HYPO|nr:hypothetical protein QQS21_007429 [Conoideocrella luteorostrata]